MRDTAFAVAFQRAGYEAPEDALKRLAFEAYQRWSGDRFSRERRAYVEKKLQNEMTYFLMSSWEGSRALDMAIGQLLNRTQKEIEAEQPQKKAEKSAGGSLLPLEPHEARAPAEPIRGHSIGETHLRAASGSEPASHSLKPTGDAPTPPSNDRYNDTIAAKLQMAQKLTKLDTVMVNDRPLGTLTVHEARRWAKANGVVARFIHLVTANMPGNWVIGDHAPKDLLDEQYARAEAEYGSA